jgi:hypothetical protein
VDRKERELVTVQGRILHAALKVARTGKRLADAEKILSDGGGQTAGMYFAALLTEWRADKEVLRQLLNLTDDETVKLPGMEEQGLFDGQTWRHF